MAGTLFVISRKSRGAPSAQALETQQPRGITLAAQTAAGEGLLEAELGPGTPSHIGVEEAWRDRTDIGSHPEVYAFASVPHEMAAGEQIHTGESEARPVEFRTPIWPVLFEEVTDEEEDHVGLDAEDALQSAKLTGALKGRPRTFHQWLNGGRLVEELVQVSHADTIEDPMEW